MSPWWEYDTWAGWRKARRLVGCRSCWLGGDRNHRLNWMQPEGLQVGTTLLLWLWPAQWHSFWRSCPLLQPPWAQIWLTAPAPQASKWTLDWPVCSQEESSPPSPSSCSVLSHHSLSDPTAPWAEVCYRALITFPSRIMAKFPPISMGTRTQPLSDTFDIFCD